MKKLFICISFALAMLVGQVAVAASSSQRMQSIQGANAFPLKGSSNKYVVRIGVNPGPLLNRKESMKTIMQKITVITCVEGDCQFMRSRPGLGFYENTFTVKKISDHKISKILVVACSSLGCRKKVVRQAAII